MNDATSPRTVITIVSLWAIFYLITVAAYLIARRIRGHGAPRWVHQVGASTAFVVGLYILISASYETSRALMIFFPAMLALYVWHGCIAIFGSSPARRRKHRPGRNLPVHERRHILLARKAAETQRSRTANNGFLLGATPDHPNTTDNT